MTPLSAREFLELAGDHLWQSTLFAAAAALVAVALRRYGASLRFWVWLAASLKFFIPVAALVALGGYGVWAELVDSSEQRFAHGVVLVVSLMHFWYDGFIWSVRRREV